MWRDDGCLPTHASLCSGTSIGAAVAKFQNVADSAADSKICPMVYTISKCDKGATGVQTCVVFTKLLFTPISRDGIKCLRKLTHF